MGTQIFLSTTAVFLLASSCAQQPTSWIREPSSSTAQYVMIKQCGEIGYTESNYNALDNEDAMYAFKLDCNGDGKVSRADGGFMIGLPFEYVSPQQKGWITRWKREIVRTTKNASSNPYVCAEIMSYGNPCETKQNSLSGRASFTQNITEFTKNQRK